MDGWTRLHVTHVLPTVMEPALLAQAMLANADLAKIAAADAAAFGIVGMAMAGALARVAANCERPRRAALFGAFAGGMALAAFSASPVEFRVQEMRDSLMRERVESYGRAVTMIDDRSRHEPGYDRERAMALSALPLLCKAFGVPGPEWTASPSAWEKHVASRLQAIR
jgi:hypothetical protein